MIEKNKVISVIVPVYNVEKYLNKCIDSIVSQTYRDLELILIDDGSLDSSSKICDDWMEKDSRINVIHKSNGGLSDARNRGIEEAKGDYLLFVDGDDYIDPMMCEYLIGAITKSKSDMAICSFYWQYDSYRKKQHMYFPKSGILKRDNVLEFWAKSSSTEYVIAWNKLYDRKLFFTKDNIRYPVGRLHEDEFTTFRLLYVAEQIVFVDIPLYYYVQRDNSITSNFGARNLLSLVDVVYEYFEWMDKYAPTKRKVIESVAMRKMLDILKITYMNKSSINGKKVSNDLSEFIERKVQWYLFNEFANSKDKIKYILFKLKMYKYIIKAFALLERS